MISAGPILVMAEKPDAARRIAQALSSGALPPLKGGGVIDVPRAFDGRHYIVCSALGHLYQLSGTESNRSVFPLLDIDWFPKYGKSLATRGKTGVGNVIGRRIRDIKEASSSCTSFVNACDYDIEGETIGCNILEYAVEVKRKPSLRAKYSTLTVEDIRDAFNSLRPSDERLSTAGRMRHVADFLWGINVSRALTIAANSVEKNPSSSSSYANLSMGRVQGPTLRFVADREIERMIHVPFPFWDLTCVLRKEGTSFEAKYKDSPVRREAEAKSVFVATKSAKLATVLSVEFSTMKIPPRYPFDLGELQRESFRIYRFSPSFALSIAEKLYLRALISYPRTESQRLPARIGPAKILHQLVLNPEYTTIVNALLSEPGFRAFPWQGPREDAAHPAIFPTGERPGSLSEVERKIYDLIVRRFCNVFAPDAELERQQALFDISSYEFLAEGTRVVREGWMKYYPYKSNFGRPLGVRLARGELVEVESSSCEEKYGPRPSRYTEGSLLSKMESEAIGTKATRAETISTLIARKYVSKESQELVPTENALILIQKLKSLCPEIVSTEMTRALEKKLEEIQSGKENVETTLEEILTSLRKALRNLRSIDLLEWKKNSTSMENDIRSPQSFELGSCPSCKQGRLVVLKSRKTHKRFIGCTGFRSGCKASSPLPSRGVIKIASGRCQTCDWPLITISYYSRRAGSRPSCANFFCEAKTSNKVKNYGNRHS